MTEFSDRREIEVFWRPHHWLIIPLGFLLRPFVFLYLNNARLFWYYMLPVCLVDLLDWYLHTKFGLVFFLVCPLHAWCLARGYDSMQRRRWYSRWWSAIVLGLVVVTVMTRAFFYEPYYVPAASMEPGFAAGDYILVSKQGYGSYGTFGYEFYNGELDDDIRLERGKVYVFSMPGSDVPYLKRLIGLPGDQLVIENDQVTLNGTRLRLEKLKETGGITDYREYIDSISYTVRINEKKPGQGVDIQVPAKQYFFLGDNRSYSRDSRYWGTIGRGQFIGEVVVVFRTTQL